MEIISAPTATVSPTLQLRSLIETWGIAAILPLPVLVAIDPSGSADIACVYLGLACAWLVTELHRTFGVPGSRPAWRARTLCAVAAVGLNVAVFVMFGLASGVTTHFPFPLMAALSAVPTIGMLPLLLRRMPSRPFVAVLLTGMIVGSCKLAACVVARVVYGPDYIAQGYVSADWRTAKLMISLLWRFSTLTSLVMLWADYRACDRAVEPPLLPREPAL